MSSKRNLLWLVAVGFFMETLDSTIVNTAIPTMARDLGESPLAMQTIVISYALALAVFIPASGWLSDRFGIRKVFSTAILIFTVGSLLCALAPNLGFLVAARALQGAGGSMMIPVGRLAILRAFPGKEYLNALAFVAMPALLGPLVGPTLGGWMVQFFSWHWIFLINIPIGIVGCIATFKTMPKDQPVFPRKFDRLGFLEIAAFMVCISIALDGIAEHNISSGVIFFLFVFGLASLVTYCIRAVKHPNPLISFELFKDRSFSIGILGNMFARIGVSCMPFLLPLFLQMCLDYSPLASGTAMIPLAAAAIAAKKLVSPLVTRFGYRNFLMFNTFLVGIMIASFALLSKMENEYLRILLFLFFGTVNSMQFTAMNTLTMKDLNPRLSSHGNTMFSMVQMLAMSFSVAAAGSLLSTFLKTNEELRAFQLTFFCMGAVTCTSVWIFSQIPKTDKEARERI